MRRLEFIVLGILGALIAMLGVLELKTHAARLDDAIARDVAGSLPVGLAVVRVIAPAREIADGATLRVIWHDPPRAGMASVEVEVPGSRATANASANPSSRVWARVELAEVRSVLCAARRLTAGERLDVDDVVVEARAARGLALDPGVIAGALVKRDVVAGAPLVEADLALPPPVPRGTPITIEIRRGAVRISAPGTLETAALPGGRATARMAGRQVTGRLTADRTLILDGGTP